MPRPAWRPKSLFEISLNYAVDNIDWFCNLDPSSEAKTLHDLPEPIAMEMRKSLVKRNKFNPRYAEMLFTHRTRELYVEFMGEQWELFQDGDVILEVASKQCSVIKELEVLRLPGSAFVSLFCTTIDPDLFRGFPNLTVLDLSKSPIVNTWLKIIGAACPKLEALNVSGTRVNDAGIRYLCCNESDNGSPQCQELVSLFIRAFDITSEGVAYAIKNLPKLKYVQHDRPLPNVAHRAVSRPNVVLKSFYCHATGRIELTKAIHLTENVYYHEDVFERGVIDRHLASFQNPVESINTEFEVSSGILLSFVNGVSPFLTRFGRDLTTIHLKAFRDINVSVVLSKCHALEKLRLDNNVSYESFVSNPFPIPPRLKKFHYQGDVDGSNVIEMELVQILKSPNLKSIVIRSCPSLTNRVFLEAFAVHRFKNLKNLELEECHLVTKETLFSIFLSEFNKLEKIKIRRCRLLSTHQCQLECFNLHERWGLEIHFSLD